MTGTSFALQKVAIDLGNRFVKLSDQGRVWSVESIYADCVKSYRVVATQRLSDSGTEGSHTSQAVEYVKGSCEELVGKAWIVGHGARNYRRGIRT